MRRRNVPERPGREQGKADDDAARNDSEARQQHAPWPTRARSHKDERGENGSDDCATKSDEHWVE